MSQSPHLWLGIHPSSLVMLAAPFRDPDQPWCHGAASLWKTEEHYTLPLTGLTTRFSNKIQVFRLPVCRRPLHAAVTPGILGTWSVSAQHEKNEAGLKRRAKLKTQRKVVQDKPTGEGT